MSGRWLFDHPFSACTCFAWQSRYTFIHPLKFITYSAGTFTDSMGFLFGTWARFFTMGSLFTKDHFLAFPSPFHAVSLYLSCLSIGFKLASMIQGT